MSESALHIAARLAGREQVLLAGHAAEEVTMSTTLLPDKLAAIRAAVHELSGAGVPYALIGALAVGVRSGVPRATIDVDFAIDSRSHRPRLVQVFSTKGFVHRGTHPHSLNFVHKSGEPVQLAFDVDFDAAIERAEVMKFGDLELRVVLTEDLLAMERRAASDPRRRRSKALRDLADIALLEGDVPDEDEGW
jgi:hypothetical protein